jgi:hypothetical protein
MRERDREKRAGAAQAPSDELILAAADRAARHRAAAAPGVPVWAILEDLALPVRSRDARHVRSRLPALQAAGLLESERRHGVPVWTLTRRGRARLRAARSAGEITLPESPQHRAWRYARTAAGEEIQGFRDELAATIERARGLLECEPPAHSDAWFELAENLRRAAWLVGSASHCLHEWSEPDDASADIDDHAELCTTADAGSEPALRRARRAGRRNVRLWRRGN